MKVCLSCICKNPDDFIVCKNCGKLLSQKDFMTVGNKTVFSVFLILSLILLFIGAKIYDRLAYKVISLPYKKYNIDVVEFKYPAKWIPLGKVFYNEFSIPNLLTFYVGTVDPVNVVEFQFFSTQFEADKGTDFEKNTILPDIDPIVYYTNIIKRISPKAKNIKLEKTFLPSKKEVEKAEKHKEYLTYVYHDINPVTRKGRVWLDKMNITNVKYIFSYEEKGRYFYHLIEGGFETFYQCYARDFEATVPDTAMKFIKCSDTFSYKAEKNLFLQNLPKYREFHNNLKINPDWQNYADTERRRKLTLTRYLTTDSLAGGEKFHKAAFKNMFYRIEYLDDYSKKEYEKIIW